MAKLLRKRGLAVWDGKKLAKEAHAYVGRDTERRTRIVDVLAVARFLRNNAPSAPPVIIDAHWSHEIPGVHTVIVLRLRPRELRERLTRRRWPAPKVAENVEAEGMGIILSETVQRLPPDAIAELDVTGLGPAEIVERLLPFFDARDPKRAKLTLGQVDWSHDVEEWASTRTRPRQPSTPAAERRKP